MICTVDTASSVAIASTFAGNTVSVVVRPKNIAHRERLTFKCLLTLWSLEFILICSNSQPCKDELCTISCHILYSGGHDGLQHLYGTSL